MTLSRKSLFVMAIFEGRYFNMIFLRIMNMILISRMSSNIIRWHYLSHPVTVKEKENGSP